MKIAELTPTLKKFAKRLIFPVPSLLRNNFRELSPSQQEEIRQALLTHFFTGGRDGVNPSDPASDPHEHVLGRLEQARTRCIPWLAAARCLDGLKVLEVGAGTGSSTLALVEQGARVTAIDMDAPALKVAEARLKSVGLQADIRVMTAETIGEAFSPNAFDLIIYYACLEHMLLSERLSSLRAAWQLLPIGGALAVYDTPNRLWFFDGHTSWLPFFHWLPDDLAVLYARHSPRASLRAAFDSDSVSPEELARRGRGVSFHDFELSLGDLAEVKVVSSRSTFEGIRHPHARRIEERRFKALLRSQAPTLHEGFFDESLDIILEK